MSILAIKKLSQLKNDVFQNAKRRIFKPLATKLTHRAFKPIWFFPITQSRH
jgi:hypothetical protein